MLLQRYGALLQTIVLEPGTYSPIRDVDLENPELPETVVRMVVAEAESYLGYEFPELTARAYLEYHRSANRAAYEAPYRARRDAVLALLLGEFVERKGRFLGDLLDGVWSICEESTWVVPAHNYERLGVFDSYLPDPRKRKIDLFAGETAALLAWTYRLVGNQLAELSAVIPVRLREEVTRRVIEPYLQSDDLWWLWFRPTPGHHINNWTPWCHSSCLAATLLMERDRERHVRAIQRAMKSLDIFLDHYAEDGGCEEGPSYWSHAAGSLLDCLDLMYCATGGTVDAYDQSKIAAMGRYLPAVHIHDRYFVNFADARARSTPEWEVVCRYARRIGDPELLRFGAGFFDPDRPFQRSSWATRRLLALFSYDSVRESSAASDAVGVPDEKPALRRADEGAAERVGRERRDVGSWFDGIQVMVSRSRSRKSDGLFLAAKGGHNDESHNHNDVGHFIVYSDGAPAIVDPGVPTYTSATFDPARRYDSWPFQSAYHNVPRIGGEGQSAGSSACASSVTHGFTPAEDAFEAELSAAYPSSVGLRRVRRKLRLIRTPDLRIVWTDSIDLDQAVDVELILMLSLPPESLDPLVLRAGRQELAEAHPASEVARQGGKRRDGGRPVRVEFPTDLFSVIVQQLKLDDSRLASVWGPSLHRCVLRTRTPVDRATWRMTMRQLG